MPARDTDAHVLQTARELLERMVCECADLESEHEVHGGNCLIEGCACPQFRPVAFTIARAVPDEASR